MASGNGGARSGFGSGTDGDSAVRTNEIGESTVREGVVEFTSGEVEYSPADENGWYPAETGQLIQSGDSVRTFTDSWCEIQFSDMSVVRLDGDTSFTVESVYDEEKSSLRLTGEVLQGTVAAKVRRLTENESLQIRTETVVCAVRGTVFLVSADSGHTTVAVSEGQVALVPEALDLDRRRQNANSDIVAMLDELENSMPLLAAGEEVVLGARERDLLVQTVESISTSLDSGMADPAMILEAGAGVSQAIGLTSEISDENAEVLGAMDRIEIAAEETSEADVRVSMTWTIQPADSEIIVNDSIVGKGRVSGTWYVGEAVQVRAARPGYEGFSGNFAVEVSDAVESIPIVLKRLPTRYFDITLSQDDGMIAVNQQEYGAPYEGAVAWGEKAHIRIQAEGFNERRYEFTYDDAPEGRIDVNLDPVIADVRQVATGSIVGLEAFGDSVVVSDQEGTLIALDGDSERLWRKVTANAPNETARPHRIGPYVFFSGINEFLIMESQSGREIARRDQDPNTMHLFGRRTVPYGNLAVYPAKDALVYIEPGTGQDVLRAPVPAGGQMTPIVHGGTVWTIATDGTVYGFDRDGRSVGRIPTGASSPIGHAPAKAGSTIFFGDRDGRITAVDLDSQSVAWTSDVGRAVQDDLGLYGNDLVVYATHDVFVLDARTGRLRYPAIRDFSAPPLLVEGFLYGGLESGEVLAMNLSTSEIVARENINGQVSSGGVVVNRRIVLGTDQGELLMMSPQHPSLLEVGPDPVE